MRDDAPSFHEIFPIEIIHMFLRYLSSPHLRNVMRVTSIWHSLINSGLLVKAILKDEHGYLMKKKRREALSTIKSTALLEKQQAIFTELAKGYNLALKDLQKERLKEFQANENNTHFLPSQNLFLRIFAVGRGAANDIEERYQGNVLGVMAHIGNAQGLKTLHETYGLKIRVPFKGLALRVAAQNDHVECVKHLIKVYRKEISSDSKELALREAAKKNALSCVKYLIKVCAQDISAEDKGLALVNAAEAGHLDCMKYLIKACNQDISEKHKNLALDKAKLYDYKENENVVASQAHSSLLTFTARKFTM